MPQTTRPTRTFTDDPIIQKERQRQSQSKAREDLRLHRLRTKANKQARQQKLTMRKNDDRAKLILGAILRHHMRKNPRDKLTLKAIELLEEYARPHERFLFSEFGISQSEPPSAPPVTLRDHFTAIH